MKIQEMKATIPHRSLALDPESELHQPLWAVISFAQTEAVGLIYSDAVAIMAKLDSNGVTGLCIVTEAAAKRVRA